MALLQVAMTFGEGLRVTDSVGGCISWPYTTIGTNANFQGPKFFIMFRFKLINVASVTAAMRVGMADSSGAFTRSYIEVLHNPALDDIVIEPNIRCDGVGLITLSTAVLPESTTEHSYALMYDNAGTWQTYVNGVLDDSGASPGCNVTGPATVGDRFIIMPSTVPGVEKFYADEVIFGNEAVEAAQVLALHQNGAG